MALTKVIGKGVGNVDELGVGTASPDNIMTIFGGASGHSWSYDSGDKLILENDDSVSINIATPNSNSANILFSDADARGQGRILYDQSSNYLAFFTNGISNERMRISSSGLTTLDAAITGGYALTIAATGSSGTPETLRLDTPNFTKDSTGGHFIKCEDSTTSRCVIDLNGSLRNHDNSYGAISDERVKQDISDASSQWDDIKAVKVRKYKKKDDVAQYKDKAWEQIGVIAQELEASGISCLALSSEIAP